MKISISNLVKRWYHWVFDRCVINSPMKSNAPKKIGENMSIIKLHEQEENNETQETIKAIIEEMQQLTFAPHEISGNDVQVFSDLLTDNIERLIKALGLNDVSLSSDSKNKPQELAIKTQLQDMYSMNDSMFYNDDKYGSPRFTDGTEITAKDLADMNMRTLENIADLIGFELED